MSLKSEEDLARAAYDLMTLKSQRDSLVEMNEFLREEIRALKRRCESLEKKVHTPHGLNRYSAGCRCEVCEAANQGYLAKTRLPRHKKRVDC